MIPLNTVYCSTDAKASVSVCRSKAAGLDALGTIGRHTWRPTPSRHRLARTSRQNSRRPTCRRSANRKDGITLLSSGLHRPDASDSINGIKTASPLCSVSIETSSPRRRPNSRPNAGHLWLRSNDCGITSFGCLAASRLADSGDHARPSNAGRFEAGHRGGRH